MIVARKISIVFGLMILAVSARADVPLLYLPFEGDCRATITGGAMAPADTHGLQYHDGLRGRAVYLTGDCRFPSPGCFDPKSGTVAFWLRTSWPGNHGTPRCLFSVYGAAGLKEPWLTNRWGITVCDGQLQYSLYGAANKKPWVLTTSIADWQPNQWHHMAVTWNRLGSGRKDAELVLLVDGRVVRRVGGEQIDIGPIASILDIGRDSDASPDYAEADFDEFYVYGRALSDAEIQRAVSLVRKPPKTAPSTRVARSRHAGWGNSDWPLRCRADVPPIEPSVTAAIVRLPWNMADDLVALGQFGCVDPDSIRVVPRERGAMSLATVLDEDGLAWRMTGKSLQQPTSVDIYFGLVDVDTSIPLYAQTQRHTWSHAPRKTQLIETDYATDTYGKGWDFDQGDFAGIDAWGDRPEYIRNRQVHDGVLSFDVAKDPYFIFGNLWDPKANTVRPVAVDLVKYPLLKMRIRQSCAASTWAVMGRFGNAPLVRHEFEVKGTQWQTLRVDLAKVACWSGVMNALRIDPPKNVEAHIEIDWIRLTNEITARRQAIEVLPTNDKPIAVLRIEPAQPQAIAGSRQTILVRAEDSSGAPCIGQPITIRLAAGSQGTLASAPSQRTLTVDPRTRRGLTDRDGRLAVELHVSRKAGLKADEIEAAADFGEATVAQTAVDSLPGPAHHYAVTPAKATCFDATQFPLAIESQLVDEHGNPLELEGRRVRLNTDEGGDVTPEAARTDKHGRVEALLRVDPARRCVYRLSARDEAGLTGRSAAVSVILQQPRANAVHLGANGYFVRADGRPFVPLGGFYANWVQDETPNGDWGKLSSFTDTSDEEKVRWMKFLHENGVSAMRFMLRTHRHDGTVEPMDVGGRVNQSLLADALRYMDLGRQFDLQFQLVLHEDYTKPIYINERHLALYSLPAFADEKLNALPASQRRFVRDRRLASPMGGKYTDRDVIECQDRYVRELLPALKGNPQVFAYELENEMVACPIDWANHALSAIRQLDPQTLLCVSHGGGGLLTADPVWWQRGTRIDFYTPHLYPDESTSAEIEYGAAVSLLTRYSRMCGPSFLGEAAGDQFSSHPSVATRRWVMRDIIWMSLTGGSPGVFFWNARGSEVQEFKLARQAMEELDLATFRRAAPEIGIDVRHPVQNDAWFQTPQGRAAYAMMGRYVQHYLTEGVDFDFTLTPEKYSRHASLANFAPPQPRRRSFAPCAGWQSSYLTRDDGHELLLYVRNNAGSEEWRSDGESSPRRQYLRKRAVRPLQLQVELEGQYRVSVYDLDAKSVRQTTLVAPGVIDLGTTDHDFGLVFKQIAGDGNARAATSAILPPSVSDGRR